MGKLTFIHTDDAPKAIGPYSQAVQAGDFLFVSGQIPIDPKTNELMLFGGNATEQAKLVLQNLDAILKKSGVSRKNVAKTTIFLADMNDFAAVNEVYGTFFGDHRPARATVEVPKLPKGVAVEIEAVAYLG